MKRNKIDRIEWLYFGGMALLAVLMAWKPDL